MLEALPHEVREVLLKYDFIKKYLDGRMPKKDFLENLKIFEKELLSQGIVRKYIQLMADADDEAEFHRKASHSRFVKFARKLGLDIATREDKVRFLKSINADDFLDILSISAGFLSGIFGFQKFRDRQEEKLEEF